GGGGLEVIDYSLDRVVDSIELILEQLTTQAPVRVVEAARAHHVPHVLVAVARDCPRIGGEYGLEKVAEAARPVRRAMLLAEIDQRFEEFGAPIRECLI